LTGGCRGERGRRREPTPSSHCPALGRKEGREEKPTSSEEEIRTGTGGDERRGRKFHFTFLRLDRKGRKGKEGKSLSSSFNL